MGTIGELLENCNATWVSMKCQHFSWLVEKLLAFRVGLCCVGLITYLTGYGTHSSVSYSKGVLEAQYAIFIRSRLSINVSPHLQRPVMQEMDCTATEETVVFKLAIRE